MSIKANMNKETTTTRRCTPGTLSYVAIGLLCSTVAGFLYHWNVSFSSRDGTGIQQYYDQKGILKREFPYLLPSGAENSAPSSRSLHHYRDLCTKVASSVIKT
jgi:hypothetical protein